MEVAFSIRIFGILRSRRILGLTARFPSTWSPHTTSTVANILDLFWQMALSCWTKRNISVLFPVGGSVQNWSEISSPASAGSEWHYENSLSAALDNIRRTRKLTKSNASRGSNCDVVTWLWRRTMCHVSKMRTATIRELQMNTGKLVRAAAHQKIIITDRGQPIALLKALDGPDLLGKPFPKRDIRKMPKSDVDSTLYVSQDRDGRWCRDSR